jgi:hypothetical protein
MSIRWTNPSNRSEGVTIGTDGGEVELKSRDCITFTKRGLDHTSYGVVSHFSANSSGPTGIIYVAINDDGSFVPTGGYLQGEKFLQTINDSDVLTTVVKLDACPSIDLTNSFGRLALMGGKRRNTRKSSSKKAKKSKKASKKSKKAKKSKKVSRK